MFDLEGINNNTKGIENSSKSFEISESQHSYLKELDVPSDVWSEMNASDRTSCLSSIIDRFEELGIVAVEVIDEIISEIFSPEIVEEYKKIEAAPQDCEQIEQVSDILACSHEFEIDNWEQLTFDERVTALNELEIKISEIEHRPACPVLCEDMGPIQVCFGQIGGMMGGFSPETKTIRLNTELIESNDPVVLRESLDTIIHEGRHAYQDYNVNQCEIHPRHSEVESWAETMDGGKWGYFGDTSTLLGQRLYEQQSIEIDARNFAADVMDKFDKKQYA